jgi:hypothetical protein
MDFITTFPQTASTSSATRGNGAKLAANLLLPKGHLKVQRALTRSPDDVRKDFGRAAPQFPAGTEAPIGDAAKGNFGVPGVKRKHLKPLLPAMDFAKYRDLKARPAPTAKPVPRAEAAAKRPEAALGPEAELAPVGALNYIEGASDVDGESPPDTCGSVGADEFVEVTNSHITIYQKTNPANQTSTALSAFFGYFNQGLFDPRAIYDSTWNRWIISADAFPESASQQLMFLAISTGPSAFGGFYVYSFNVTFNSGDFWDFPMIGMDQDSVIVTANVFDTNGNLRGADMLAIAKARLYNGLGFSVPVFTGLVSTLATTIVLDQNPETYLLAAPPSGNALQLYTLTNSSRPGGIALTGPVAIPVDAYAVPPPAQQPGLNDPADDLDTGDCRFVNVSTQNADSLWNTHTVALASWPAPKFYEVSPSTASVRQSAFYYASGTSFDFNASIAANGNNDVFLTRSSTDPPNNINAQVRFDGSVGVGGAGFSPGPGTALVTSAVGITGDFDPRFGLQRWGDYSQTSIDPSNPVQAWIVNEKVNSANVWGSGIGVIG